MHGSMMQGSMGYSLHAWLNGLLADALLDAFLAAHGPGFARAG
jgi:hypothetical protein